MEGRPKKSYNLGSRGWILVIYQAVAFFAQTMFKNYPLNYLSGYFGGSQRISLLCTVAMLVGVVVQLLCAKRIGRVKNMKRLGLILGIISMAFGLGVMAIPPKNLILWQIFYFLTCTIVTIWATFPLGILVGQWFPRRKGTVMGIATFAFPVANACGSFFAKSALGETPRIFSAFLPYFIAVVIGMILGAIFLTDYPEQCGAYRDNDKNMTPEIANRMLAQEIENKKTTVWTPKHTMATRDFWFITIPMGLLLMTSVGMMTQTAAILVQYGIIPGTGQFTGTMMGISGIACLGSWVLGVVDTKYGTKLAILISVIIMTIGGVFGSINNLVCLMVALACLGLFMGAASNFTVSSAAQYWRREDFSSVYSNINPIANVFGSLGPMVIAWVVAITNARIAYMVVGVCGVISIILVLLFKPSHVKEVDDKYRAEAGKPLDDALAGRR